MVLEINMLKTSQGHSKIQRSHKDTFHQLFKQYKFLCKSLLECIKGDLDEIDRVATSLRILFHDSNKSKSLISQLNSEILILDTADNLPDLSLPSSESYECHSMFIGGMVNMNLCSRVWGLNLAARPVWSNIESWWNKILFIDNSFECTRKKIVLIIANTDGGAHVDPMLDKDYYQLTRDGSIGMNFFLNGQQYTPSGPEKIILPQIGLEVVTSLRNAYPHVCIDMGIPYLNSTNT